MNYKNDLILDIFLAISSVTLHQERLPATVIAASVMEVLGLRSASAIRRPTVSLNTSHPLLLSCRLPPGSRFIFIFIPMFWHTFIMVKPLTIDAQFQYLHFPALLNIPMIQLLLLLSLTLSALHLSLQGSSDSETGDAKLTKNISQVQNPLS